MSIRRFVNAQEGVYGGALEELHNGRKRSHWMWFVFPQLAGLGRSETAQYHAIAGTDEAKDYLADPQLARRLAECTDAVLAWVGKRTAEDMFGEVDALKFASSMTLFEAAGGGERFAAALEGFYDGRRDERTLSLLGMNSSNRPPFQGREIR